MKTKKHMKNVLIILMTLFLLLAGVACDASDPGYMKVVDTHGNVVSQDAKTAFGLLAVAEMEPTAQLQFTYNIHTLLVNVEENSGTVTQANSMAHLSTGAGANQSATLLSRREVPYTPGVGVLFRGTAVFTTGVANSIQCIGIGDAFDGFFFGYSGASFGIIHRTGGEPEIQTLTITTASNTAEDITITLNGVAVADVTVTAAGADSAVTRTTTANDIATHDFSDTGAGWTAKAVGATVQFIARDSGAKAGAFTLSGAVTAVGAFAETDNGIATTETTIAQTAWSEDKMAGAGSSGMTLDPTKGNVYQIQYQWLGFGQIVFSLEDQATGDIVVVHRITYTNQNTIPSIANPTANPAIIANVILSSQF